jgi:hypothetical protein
MEREIGGLAIPSDSELPVEARQLTELVDCQKAVSGWIEAVDVRGLGVTLYVNEEGLPRRLPLNVRATFLWWHHDPRARGISILVGDVVHGGCARRGGARERPCSSDHPGPHRSRAVGYARTHRNWSGGWSSASPSFGRGNANRPR